jgi:hypothetical protein
MDTRLVGVGYLKLRDFVTDRLRELLDIHHRSLEQMFFSSKGIMSQ